MTRVPHACAAICSALILAACSDGGAPASDSKLAAAPKQGAAGEAAPEPAKGPNGGKLFTDGDFTLELAIFEDGVPPQYRAWATRDGEKVPPGEVELAVTLKRLGGKAG